MDRRPQLTDLGSAYGAPMGRTDAVPFDPTEAVDLVVQALLWEDGDYDTGGAYWGHTRGTRIYWAHGQAEHGVRFGWLPDKAEGAVDVFVRAKSPDEAMAQLRQKLGSWVNLEYVGEQEPEESHDD